MSDIIVRIPKTQYRHFLDDKMTSNLAFWRFAKRPRKLEVGSHIFFTRPEGVVFAARVKSIVEGEKLTDDINPIHMIGDAGNWNATWDGRKTRLITPGRFPNINYAQQGYRYLTQSEQKRLRKAVQ